jgi:hypothetical protein
MWRRATLLAEFYPGGTLAKGVPSESSAATSAASARAPGASASNIRRPVRSIRTSGEHKPASGFRIEFLSGNAPPQALRVVLRDSLDSRCAGEKEAALTALRRAYEDHAVEFGMIDQYPPFRTIAAEPGFQAVIRLIGAAR